MKYGYLLFLLCLVFNHTQAQSCNLILQGTIIDYHDNTPLNEAIITISGTTQQTISAIDGTFYFTALCPGILELEIAHHACKSLFVPLDLQENTFKEIRLEHHLEALEEVEVTGRSNNKSSSAHEAFLTASTISKNMGGTLGDALKELAGITTLSTGAAIVKPVIHGLSGSRVLILNNNVRMQDMEWGEEHAPNIDMNTNKNIQIIKGAAALEFGGDAIAGVIKLLPEPVARQDSLYGQTQTQLFSNGKGGALSTTLIKSYESGLFIKGQGSFKRLGDLNTPDYLLTNTGVLERGISFTVSKRDFRQGWEAYYALFDAEIGILRASHIGNVDDFITAVNIKQPNTQNDFSYAINNPKQEVQHQLVKASFYQRFEGLGKWTTQYDFQKNHRFEYDIRLGADADKAALDLQLTTHSLATDLKIDAWQNAKFKVGLLGRHQANIANPLTGVRRLIPDYMSQNYGAFITVDHRLTDNLLIDGGLRYDFTQIDAKKFYRTSRWEERGYDATFSTIVTQDLGTQLLTNPVFQYHAIAATAGIIYKLDDDLTLRGNFSFSQRAPNPSELFSDGLHHSAARIELGDLNIKSESASNISVAIEKDSELWGFVLSPYINTINDFILLDPTGVEFTIRGAFPVWSYRQTNAQLVGLDFTAYGKWSSHVRTDHTFSLVYGTDKSLRAPLINIPPPSFTNTISYTNQRWNNLTLGLTSEYVFRQNNTPPNIAVFSPEQQATVVLEINTPPEAYHLLRLHTEIDFELKNNKKITLGLQATNLGDTKYRAYLNRLRYFVDDLGRNISTRILFNY